MIGWLKHHGLQVLVATAAFVGAFQVDYAFFFTDNLGVVEPGRLVRSPQPLGEGWRVLERFGVQQIINLRTREEDPRQLARTRQAARDAGATMVHIPIAARLPNLGQIEDFLFAARREGITSLVHCQHGEDRTGMLVAAWRVVVNGWSVRKAMAEMARYRADTDRVDMRFLRKMLHQLRIDRASWLRRTDPTNVWVRRPAGSENRGVFRIAHRDETLYIR